MDDDKTRHEELESTEAAYPQSVPPERVGPFRILERLGEGGMGVVYLAEQTEPVRRKVALKIIKHGMDTKQVVARFEAERQALAMMDHPCVAKVFDAGSTEGGRPYFAMEYVKGVPITEHCDRQRLTTDERLELFQQVCEGVQHAHQKAILHRDLKPSNVLVSYVDGKAAPKIIDFGVAKAIEHRLTEKTLFTEMGVLIGTPEYMSPEQAEMTGQNVDTRTDVYSLGVMLYELLVGALPFESKELRQAGFDEIRRKIREEEPSKPSTRLSTLGGERSRDSARRRRTDLRTLRRQLRGDLDWITLKALEKERTRRYGSPLELAEEIHRHRTNRPVVARPPSTVYRLGRFARRNRAVAVSAGVTLVAVALVASLLAYDAIASRRQRMARAKSLLQEIIGSEGIPESLQAELASFHEFIRSERLNNPSGALAQLEERADAGMEVEFPAGFGLVSDPPRLTWSARSVLGTGAPLRFAVQVEASWDSGPWKPFVHGSYAWDEGTVSCAEHLSRLLDQEPGPGPHTLELRGIFSFPRRGDESSDDPWTSTCGGAAAPARAPGSVVREVRPLGLRRVHLFEEYPDDFPRADMRDAATSSYPFRLERVRILALSIDAGTLPDVRFEFPDGMGCIPLSLEGIVETEPLLGAIQLLGSYDFATVPPIAGRASVGISGDGRPVVEFDFALGGGTSPFTVCRIEEEQQRNCGFAFRPEEIRTLGSTPAGTHAGWMRIVPSREVALATGRFDRYLGTELALEIPVEIVPTPITRIGSDLFRWRTGPCPEGS